MERKQMNRTIQNPKRVSIIVDNEALKKIKELLKLSGTSFSFFVRAAMDDFNGVWEGVDPVHTTYFTAYRFWPPGYKKITPVGKEEKKCSKK